MPGERGFPLGGLELRAVARDRNGNLESVEFCALSGPWKNWFLRDGETIEKELAGAVRLGEAQAGLPEDAFNASGGQGHYVMIVPSKGLVVVRRGFDTQSRFDIHRFTADVLKAVGR